MTFRFRSIACSVGLFVGLTFFPIGLYAQYTPSDILIETAEWSISEGQRQPCEGCTISYNLIVEAVAQNANRQYSLEIHESADSITDMGVYDSILSVTGSFPGGESVTVFDLEDGSRVTEFYGYHVARSPDSRYFIYQKFYPRFGSVRPDVVMLMDVLESRESDRSFLMNPRPDDPQAAQDVGIPIYPPQERPNPFGPYPHEFQSMGIPVYPLFVFDMDSRKAFFPVVDEFDNLSIASVTLWQQRFTSEFPLCVVPLMGESLTSNYLGREILNRVVEIEPSGSTPFFLDVSLNNTRGVATSFRLNMDRVCGYNAVE